MRRPSTPTPEDPHAPLRQSAVLLQRRSRRERRPVLAVFWWALGWGGQARFLLRARGQARIRRIVAQRLSRRDVSIVARRWQSTDVSAQAMQLMRQLLAECFDWPLALILPSDSIAVVTLLCTDDLALADADLLLEQELHCKLHDDGLRHQLHRDPDGDVYQCAKWIEHLISGCASTGNK